MKTSVLEQTDFDTLLDWLSPNREEAGKKYEEIREGLIRFFRFKGVINPEELADETISRVSAKIDTFEQPEDLKTITYFLGFATKILQEYGRDRDLNAIPLDAVLIVQEFDEVGRIESDKKIRCLKQCLRKLSPEEEDLIFDYYSEEKTKKIEIRKKLAEQYNCEMMALHVRVHRLRSKLGNCIKRCLKKKM